MRNRQTAVESLPRKEREKLAHQREILKAARDLFVARGFRETTLDDIAHHAEFGKGTIYNYFANKDEIFLGIIEQSIEEILAIARESAAAPGGVREKLRCYAEKLILYVKDSGEMLHVIYHEMHRSDAPTNLSKRREIMSRASGSWELLAEPLRMGMEDGSLRRSDPIQLIVLFDGMVRGYCFRRFTVDRPHTDDDFAAAAAFITSTFLDGIKERKSEG
jgi:TetR/AcrR family transcriptional regulator, repressor of fatR-cypB operon